MLRNKKSLAVVPILIVMPLIAILFLLTIMYAEAQDETTSNNLKTNNSSASSSTIQQSSVDKDSYDNTTTDGNVLRRGIISSEPGQPEELKVQRTVILPHRQDGKDYTGILTFTASEPVEVLLGHRLNIDNKTLSNTDMKKFGDLFLVNPIHPNAGYILSAPTVIKPDYKESSPPYYSESIPFVASSVVLRTLGGVTFIAVYEVNAHVGQPQVINNMMRANNSNSTNATSTNAK
jgi:competence protein ComGC